MLRITLLRIFASMSKVKLAFDMQTPQGAMAVELGIIGQHNVANALAAAALSTQFGATLEEIKAV